MQNMLMYHVTNDSVVLYDVMYYYNNMELNKSQKSRIISEFKL